jgi:hypothetical protein
LRVDERLRREAPPEQADTMRAGMFILMGLRYEATVAEQLLQEVQSMEESSTYQLLISRGQVREARALLLRVGRLKFKQDADGTTKAALDGMTDLERLERLHERLLSVNSWQELLSSP